jgi:hypothetical protein
MNAITSLILFGWIPFVLILFMLLPPRRAVVSAFVIAWLFLPMAQITLIGLLPNYDKISATCLGVFMATAIFDSNRFATYRARWYDLPMLVWCVVPFFSAMSTGYGAYEGLAGIRDQVITWGLPYLIGRVYFNSLDGLEELAMGIIIGGIVYIPLCLYEIRMSPQLHTMLYGYHQHDFGQAKRGGGWRPTVFMQHGLAVATFMCTATLLATWIGLTQWRRTVFNVPLLVIAAALMVTAVLCKSTGATLLMLAGIAALLFSRTTSLSLPLWGLICAPFAYVYARTYGGWDAGAVVELAKSVSSRALQSVQYRLHMENALWQSVQPQALLGATRFYWAQLPRGERIVPDGLWIIALGKFGIVGVVSIFICFATPVALFLKRFKARLWKQPGVAVAAGWAMCLALWAVDCLSNAMTNPIFLLAAGGLAAAPTLGARVAKGRPTRSPVPAFSLLTLGPRHAPSATDSDSPRIDARRQLPPT